jgi:SET domain-containing protein
MVAQKDIKAGEELTFDYGSDGKQIGSKTCHCGTRKCRNFLPFHAKTVI